MHSLVQVAFAVRAFFAATTQITFASQWQSEVGSDWRSDQRCDFPIFVRRTIVVKAHLPCAVCRLSLDKEDIESGEGFSAEEVLLLGSLSAKWGNADAIDTAVTAAVVGGAEVCNCMRPGSTSLLFCSWPSPTFLQHVTL